MSSRDISVIHGPAALVASKGIVTASGTTRSRLVDDTMILPGGLVHLRGIGRVLADLRPTSIVVEANPRFISSYVVLRWARRHQIPCVLWGLGSGNPSSSLSGRIQRRIGTFVLRRYLSLAAGAIAYGARAADEYERLSGSAVPITVAPNATRPVGPLGQARPAVGPYPNRFLFLGRLVDQKRVDVLLRAWAGIEALEADGRLTIAGDGPLRADLEELSRRLKLERVRFIGTVPRGRVREVLAESNWVVLPGAGGLVAKEALEVGTPIVLPQVGAGDGTLDDLLVDEVNAIVGGTAGGVDELRDNMRRAMVVRPAAWARMSAASVASVKATYQQMLDNFLGALEEVESSGGNSEQEA